MKMAKPSAKDIAQPAEDRTTKDYAIEHAEYMALNAEQLIQYLNEISCEDDGVIVPDDRLGDFIGGLQSGIYEFRKRRDRCRSRENNRQNEEYSPSTSYEPVWDMFGPTYASWLVWPRVIMQAMDLDWQRKFAALAVELNKRFPDWEPKGSFHVGLRVNGKMQKLPEELCNYRRPVDKYRRPLIYHRPGNESEQSAHPLTGDVKPMDGQI